MKNYQGKKLNDVVTDWSYALICFLVSMLFPRPILTIFRIANVFVGLIIFNSKTCVYTVTVHCQKDDHM